ncbi:uncharacterized protein ACNLHF_009980 [Anomaloglossus baeobatrachus]
MEDAFLELYQEFKNLQIICLKQAELLQKLLSKKGHTNEIPVSKPIQCTDTGSDARSESPFFRLEVKEDQCAEASKNNADSVLVPLDPKDPSSLPLALDSSWSPGRLSEDCPFAQRVDVNSDVGLSSQICEFCHAVFPAGAATEGEFLGHLAGHMESSSLDHSPRPAQES